MCDDMEEHIIYLENYYEQSRLSHVIRVAEQERDLAMEAEAATR